MITDMRTAADNRRYYLHQRLKKIGVSYDPDWCRIDILERKFDELTPKQRTWIGELICNHGYNIQLILFEY